MNLIWVVSDTFRRDQMGCYGNHEIHTPALDAFSAKATRFDRHYLASFPTMPTRADFYTGRWTFCYMGWEPIPRGQKTFPNAVSRAGIHTTAVVDTPFYTRNRMNYDVGFRTYLEIPGQEYWAHAEGDDIRASWRFEQDCFAPRTFTTAMSWLERHHKEKFLLYIDTWDPHEPWDAPRHFTELYLPGYDGEKVKPIYSYWQDVPGMSREKVEKAFACYKGEITMVDTWFGYLIRHLENLNLMENTAVIFTTDHGFYFGEHGGLFGKSTRAKPSATPYWEEANPAWISAPLFEVACACPLLVYVPGVKPAVYSGLTSAVDIMPTVLELLGVEIPPEVEGHSLVPAMRDTNVKGRDFVVSASPFPAAGPFNNSANNLIGNVDFSVNKVRPGAATFDTTITTPEWSLLYSMFDTPLLYHLPSDPGQEKDLAGKRPEVAREIHSVFTAFLKERNVAEPLITPRLSLKL